VIDHLAPWLRAEIRVRCADAEEARLARDTLVRTGARDDVPFVIQQTLALLEISVLSRTP
jgi:hypothetical protein